MLRWGLHLTRPQLSYLGELARLSRAAELDNRAKVVADMLSNAGVDHVLTVDLHAEQIQGFFNCTVDNVYGAPVMIDHLERQNYKNLRVVSPDIGGVVRARAVAKQLDCDLAIIDKRRPSPNESEVMNLIGEVDKGTCVLIDDMVDTKEYKPLGNISTYEEDFESEINVPITIPKPSVPSPPEIVPTIVPIGASGKTILNRYYKEQLLAFLYKV